MFETREEEGRGWVKMFFPVIHWGNVIFVALTGLHTNACTFEAKMQQSMFKHTYV